jgi:hypothetical protein
MFFGNEFIYTSEPKLISLMAYTFTQIFLSKKIAHLL